MQNVKVDGDGQLRCWSCGGRNLITQRSKMGWKFLFLGFFALFSRKHLRCQQCGAMNRTGNAEPFTDRSNAGWWPDPTGRQARRYHDGTRWTEHAQDASGATVTDPIA